MVTSFILFEFIGNVIVKKDLGYGIDENTQLEIPCKATRGLIPLEGNQIICFLQALDPPRIKIINYQRVRADSWIKILIPNIENPNGSWVMSINCV